MGHRIPYRLLLNIQNVLSKRTIRSYRQCAAHNVNLTITVCPTRSKSIKFPFSTNVKEYLHIRELDKEESLFGDLDNGTPDKELVESIHTRLYPSIHPTEDPLLESLVHANTIEEVFELIKDKFLNEKYASQAIATLCDLEKVYCHWTSSDPVNTVENYNNFRQVPIISYKTIHCVDWLLISHIGSKKTS